MPCATAVKLIYESHHRLGRHLPQRGIRGENSWWIISGWKCFPPKQGSASCTRGGVTITARYTNPYTANSGAAVVVPRQTASIAGGTLCPDGANVSGEYGTYGDGWYEDVTVSGSRCSLALQVVKAYGVGTAWSIQQMSFTADGFDCVTKIAPGPYGNDEGTTTCTLGASMVRWVEPPGD